MQKEEIIKKLEDSAFNEDEFMAKYDNDSFWKLLQTIPKDEFRRVEELFRENLRDTAKHKKLLQEAAEKVRSGKYDV